MLTTKKQRYNPNSPRTVAYRDIQKAGLWILTDPQDQLFNPNISMDGNITQPFVDKFIDLR